MIDKSCLYIGSVIHKRFKPKEHFFKYKVFSLYLNLDEIDEVQKKIPFFSYNKFNLISFYDKDHGERDGSSLKLWVQKKLNEAGIGNEIKSVNLLCYPRIFGYVFNPLSIFFVFDKYSSLIAIMYEVKNTFGEQHTYIFKTYPNKNLCSLGAYEVLRTNKKINLTILASGSEVNLALEVSHKLAKDKIYSKVISMPCMELFELQSKSYKNKILEETKFKISIEAGSSDCWKKYVGDNGITFGIDEFGKSAPYKDIYKYFGLESTNIKNITKKLLNK